MTEQREDGGPAFPHDGMSMRDWFAGQALAAIIAKHHPMGEPGTPDTGREIVPHGTAQDIMKSIARGAYRYADAMIEARSK